MDVKTVKDKLNTLNDLLQQHRECLERITNMLQNDLTDESRPVEDTPTPLPEYLVESSKGNSAGLETEDLEIAVSESASHIYVETWAKMPSGERRYLTGHSVELKIFGKGLEA